jgi:hypothetical protein
LPARPHFKIRHDFRTNILSQEQPVRTLRYRKPLEFRIMLAAGRSPHTTAIKSITAQAADAMHRKNGQV